MIGKNNPFEPDPHFEVHDESIEFALREIGDAITSRLPKGYGFTLMIFQYGEKGNMFYISNAKRPDMIRSLKEFINKLKRG